ncbi:CPBP family intramembrane metalloprotease [bacterium]|nr:CPBP family intramembrane metalloprotease [bacterium]
MPTEWIAMATLAVLGSAGTLATLVRRRWQGSTLARQADAEPVTWSGVDVAWIVAVALVLQALAVSVGPQPQPLERQLVAGMLATGCAAAIAAVYLRRRGASWAMLGFHVADWPAALKQALGTVLLVVAPLLALAAFLDRIVPYRHPIVDFLAEHRDAASLALVWLAATVTAPIVEEFFFRRVLQGWLETWLTSRGVAAAAGGLAVIGSALAFALAHLGQGLAWVPLVVLGVVLGGLARQTGSIVPGILAHALFNAVSVVLVLLQPAR